jgi:hypothetical protein
MVSRRKPRSGPDPAALSVRGRGSSRLPELRALGKLVGRDLYPWQELVADRFTERVAGDWRRRHGPCCRCRGSRARRSWSGCQPRREPIGPDDGDDLVSRELPSASDPIPTASQTTTGAPPNGTADRIALTAVSAMTARRRRGKVELVSR